MEKTFTCEIPKYSRGFEYENADWKVLLMSKNGHRYFRYKDTNFVGIVDKSARYPHGADDGVLWLDPARPIHAGRGGSFMVPCRVAKTDRPCHTVCGLEEAAEVSRLFGLRIEAGEYDMTLTKRVRR